MQRAFGYIFFYTAPLTTTKIYNIRLRQDSIFAVFSDVCDKQLISQPYCKSRLNNQQIKFCKHNYIILHSDPAEVGSAVIALTLY